MKKMFPREKLGIFAQQILLEMGRVATDITFAGPRWRGLRRDLHRAQYREQTRLYRALIALEKRGLIERTGKHIKDGLVLTTQGKRTLKRLQADQLFSPKLKAWDGKWHLVIFDVPEEHRTGRDLLRRRLTKLGCQQIQKSVFLYPYDLRPIVEKIRDAYDLRTDIIYIVAETLDRAAAFQSYFTKHGILPNQK